MGYVEDQIAAYQKSLTAAVSGQTLTSAIKSLQDKSRIKSTLKPLDPKPSIKASTGIGKRTGSSASSFTEVARTYYTTVRELRSSDGLFVLQFKNLKTWTTDSGAIFTYLDYQP